MIHGSCKNIVILIIIVTLAVIVILIYKLDNNRVNDQSPDRCISGRNFLVTHNEYLHTKYALR